MSVGFGFSVGDFIAAVKLVGTVIDALSTSSHSSVELQELLRQLQSLAVALREVETLQVDESLFAEIRALKQSAALCQLTINEFLQKTESYQPHLLPSSNVLKGSWKKVKWALCKSQDVNKFKADLVIHTESIQLLLATMQMKNVELNRKSLQCGQISIFSRIQTNFSTYMRKLANLTTMLEPISRNAQECLENSRRIISMNFRVFQVVLNIQKLLSTNPGQIDRQQPVHLFDAVGRYAPFHLEFIKCSEALINVLSINFRGLGAASKMIQNGDFALQDSHTTKDINLEGAWEGCFTPGQKVEMIMIFDRPKNCSTSCPKCRFKCIAQAEQDVDCENCGIIFRSFSVNDNLEKPPKRQLFQTRLDRTFATARSSMRPIQRPTISKRKFEDEVDLTNYRRVRLRVSQAETITRNWTGQNYLAKLYSLINGDWYDQATGFVEAGSDQNCVYIRMLSENSSNDIIFDEVYQDQDNPGFEIQQQTLIFWTDSYGRHMALSFQEVEHCVILWRVIQGSLDAD